MNIDWFVVVGLTISILLFVWAMWVAGKDDDTKRKRDRPEQDAPK